MVAPHHKRQLLERNALSCPSSGDIGKPSAVKCISSIWRMISGLMSRVKNLGTAAERYVRQAVWNDGFRYRLNVRKLPGTPDLVLPRYRTVVLVQGCFWHGHSCRKGQRRPATNKAFWDRKLDGNIARDIANHTELRSLGWTVFVIWECRLKDDTTELLSHLRQKRVSFSDK